MQKLRPQLRVAHGMRVLARKTQAQRLMERGAMIARAPDGDRPRRTLLATVFEQHEQLRAIMDRCDELAEQLDIGTGDVAELTREVINLRVALDAHNQVEEQLLRELLRQPDGSGGLRSDHIFNDHIGEHRSMRLSLGDATTNALRAAIDSLRGHLHAEERYLFSAHHHDDDAHDQADADHRPHDDV
jgi:Hemerythrin HHE cation binding domain